MGGKVADGVDKTVGILRHMGEIGSLPVPPLHIPQQPEIVLALHFGQVECDREELLHELHHLLIGQPDFRQGINAPAQLNHVPLGQSQSLLGLMNTAHDVLGVFGRPDTLGAVQSKVEGVLADHPNGGHGYLDTAAAVVGVHDHQIGRDFIPGDDVTVRYPGQHPDFAATLQGPGSLIGHALAQQIIGELESVFILHHLVAVAHDAQGGVVGAAGVDLIPSDQGAVFGVDILLDNLPIQTGEHKGVNGRGSSPDTDTQAMPGLFAEIEHRFNVCRHHFYLLNLIWIFEFFLRRDR